MLRIGNKTPDHTGGIDVAIIVPSVDMDPKIYKRLMESLYEHESTKARWSLYVVDRDDEEAARFGKGAEFNLSAAKNRGIRAAIADGARIIACTDADYIIPAGLVDFLAAETGNRHFWIGRRDVDPAMIATRDWARWVELPCRAVCKGSFNAMSAANWKEIGGWDERCVGYGGEDNVLHRRISHCGIETISHAEFPLIHVSHGRTDREFSRANYRGEANAKSDVNTQPNYIDNPPAVVKVPTIEDGLTFAILTCNRPELFISTVESFLENCSSEDLARITDWQIYDHGSPPQVRQAIIEYFKVGMESNIPFTLVEIPAELEYWQARQVMLEDIDTPFALLWEDDWNTYRSGDLISEAWRIMQHDRDIKTVTYRYWPAKVVRDQTVDVSGITPTSSISTNDLVLRTPAQQLVYRIHENLGHATGPKGYQDYYASHWPSFSWNPSLQNMAALRSALPVTPRTERAIGEQYDAAGFKMAYTYQGYVEHTGTESKLGKVRKAVNVKGS